MIKTVFGHNSANHHAQHLPNRKCTATQAAIADKTIVVMLGTGAPGWDPDRSGPAIAIVVNNTPYLVDFGPGVVRRAGAADKKGGKSPVASETIAVNDKTCASTEKALYPPNIRVAFLTHRPRGSYGRLCRSYIQSGASRRQHIATARSIWPDRAQRNDRAHPQSAMLNPNDERYKVNAHEIKPGIVYKDVNVTVTAFPVK